MNKKELKALLAEEAKIYFPGKTKIGEARFRHSRNYVLWKAVESLRKYEYACAKRDKATNPLALKIRALGVKFADRKRNKNCEKAGVELSPGRIGKNIRICHSNVVINGYVGDGCVFHGNNVMGNKRTGESDSVPTLGRGVDVGNGAMIIGKVNVADNCVIGAGAVVTKSFDVPGTVIAGVPAKAMSERN